LEGPRSAAGDGAGVFVFAGSLVACANPGFAQTAIPKAATIARFLISPFERLIMQTLPVHLGVPLVWQNPDSAQPRGDFMAHRESGILYSGDMR
jgi:hypothetical protein